MVFLLTAGLFADSPGFLPAKSDIHVGIWDWFASVKYPFDSSDVFKQGDYPQFLAMNFVFLVEDTRYPLYFVYGDSIHRYIDNVPIFRYKSIFAEKPMYDAVYADTFKEWTECNKNEFSFLHSGCPARLTAVPDSNKITLNWTHDARDSIFDRIGNFEGYCIYRRKYPSLQFTKIGNVSDQDTCFIDSTVLN
jgi:hypothetical protein